jgi:preprotein translocase subunit SecA
LLCETRRFKDNSQTVTASALDREFSGIKAYEGDQSIWQNKWNAGKEITWDMIHYDVQLIGGMN